MKVVIIIGTMIHGGAHRVACIQANELSLRGYDVTLLLVVGSDLFPYDISSRVKIIFALPFENLEFSTLKSKVFRKLKAIPALIKAFKSELPDIVISHGHGTNREAILASKLSNVLIICCEHTNIHLPIGFRGKLKYIERRFIYKLASAITILTNYDLDNFYSHYHNNVTVLPNPCPFQPKIKTPMADREKTVLAVGDLNRIDIKGWDSLIQLFSKVSETHHDWKLEFAGEGKRGTELISKMAVEHGILDKVSFLGSVKNIEQRMQNSSIFILSSRFEGLPMALIEAMSQGCACIAFDCKTGPSDIINDGLDGILVEDQNIKQMVIKLEKLIGDVELREYLSKNALINSKRFSKEDIFNQWMNLIEDVVK